jgi:hypothetical protein
MVFAKMGKQPVAVSFADQPDIFPELQGIDQSRQKIEGCTGPYEVKGDVPDAVMMDDLVECVQKNMLAFFFVEKAAYLDKPNWLPFWNGIRCPTPVGLKRNAVEYRVDLIARPGNDIVINGG